MFLEELADLKDRYPDRFQLVHVLSREAQRGRAALRPARRAAAAPAARRRCCRRRRSTSGSSAGRSRWSRAPARCSPRPASASRTCTPSCSTSRATAPRESGRRPRRSGRPGRAACTVTLDGRASTVAGAARRRCGSWTRRCAVRADAPYACKGGVCGTCRAKVVDGEVTMDRNYALEPDETAAGYVLACQSRAGDRGRRAGLRRLRSVAPGLLSASAGCASAGLRLGARGWR